MTTQFHKGAVAFIDLLGFSYLTNLLENKEIYNDSTKEKNFGERRIKELSIGDFRLLEDYIKYGATDIGSLDEKSNKTISDWAFNIVDENLRKFHSIVERICSNYQNVEFCVISDSIFIVSENSDDILFILSNIFRECIKSGILLRAGLAYGTYYSVKTHISSLNIYGTAVTKAVNYEKLGKGCRIFTDSEFPSTTKLMKINIKLFAEYKNYQNYTILDCFEWLMIDNNYVFNPVNIKDSPSTKNHQNAVKLFCDNLQILSYLRYSPKFEWNLKSLQGIEQLGVSIEYISSLIDKIYASCSFKQLDIFHEKITEGRDHAKNQKRSDKIMNSIIQQKIDELKSILH